MVEKLKDAPVWVKLALTAVLSAVGAVWAAGEFKGSTGFQLESHETRLNQHDTVIAAQANRLRIAEQGLAVTIPTLSRLETAMDQNNILMMEFIRENAKLQGYLKSIEIIEESE